MNTLEHRALGGYGHALGPWVKKRVLVRNEQRSRVRFNLEPIKLCPLVYSISLILGLELLNICKIGYASDKV